MTNLHSEAVVLGAAHSLLSLIHPESSANPCMKPAWCSEIVSVSHRGVPTLLEESEKWAYGCMRQYMCAIYFTESPSTELLFVRRLLDWV